MLEPRSDNSLCQNCGILRQTFSYNYWHDKLKLGDLNTEVISNAAKRIRRNITTYTVIHIHLRYRFITPKYETYTLLSVLDSLAQFCILE